MEIIHIREPYYTAGKQFGWEGKSIGLGIAEHLFQKPRIYVTVGNNKKIWTITTEKAKQFVNKHKSFHYADGTKLWVIAWEQFEEYQGGLE